MTEPRTQVDPRGAIPPNAPPPQWEPAGGQGAEPPQRDPRRFGWLALLSASVVGTLVGVLLVIGLAALAGEPVTDSKTTTVTRTETVPAAGGTDPTQPIDPTAGQSGEDGATTPEDPTVITTTPVPLLIGQPLDVAKERVARSGFDVETDGGGILGILDDSAWVVVDQSPAPGTDLETGSTVTLKVDRP